MGSQNDSYSDEQRALAAHRDACCREGKATSVAPSPIIGFLLKPFYEDVLAFHGVT